MASDMEMLVLTDVGTLSPLPTDVKKGIIAMGICGLLSFLSCGLLFIYISYRLLLARSSRDDSAQIFNAQQEEVLAYLALGTGANKTTNALRSMPTQDSYSQRVQDTRSNKPDSNSFLTLIHNLLVADMLQALAFLFNLSWWQADGIFVTSESCGAQAFFVMLGSVSISVFLIAISINTFLTIVWGFKFSRLVARSVVAISWAFSFTMAFVGLGVNMHTPTDNDQQFFARSISLCWINHRYAATFGLWLQNIWLILAVAITVVCYTWIFAALLRNKQSPRHMPQDTRRNSSPRLSGHHPAFLIYPAIYIITNAPLSMVGVLSVSGSYKVSSHYFSLAAAVSSLAGLLDAALWSTTILMSSSENLKEVGLDTYKFMRTPSRAYGNIVWVEGATRDQPEHRGSHSERRWWKLHSDLNSSSGAAGDRIIDDDNHMKGIHMDTITTVQVESNESTRSAGPSSSQVPKAYHPT